MPAPSGTTPRLQLPYPTPDDDVDVPRDVQALAMAIDGGGVLYIGEVRFMALVAAPAGWLPADGAAISRSGYPKLYAAIGVSFGGGDGSTTFNVPDLRGRVPVGAGPGPGLTARAVGTKWGVEAVLLTAAQSGVNGNGATGYGSADHTHSYNQAFVVATLSNAAAGADFNVANALGAQTGGQSGPHLHALTARNADATHDNTQPSLAIPAYIYAGA